MVQQMAVPGTSTAQLLFSVPLVDEQDELAERLEKDFTLVTSIQNGSSQKEGRDKLSQAATQNIEKYVDLMDGLLYGILTDPLATERFFGDMTVLSMLNAEAFGPVIKTLNTLVHEKFSKLSETAKKQSVWLLKNMTKCGIANLDRVHIPFMRNLTAGENWKNIPLLESYMEIFAENRSFVEAPSSGPIVQMAVLTFVQLIQYHHPLQYSVIKDKEMDFCLDLLRLRLTDCALVGRELIRSLMSICKMPKMKEFWSDLVNNPKNLGPSAGGLQQMLQSKTPRWIFAHRISGELETKVIFLLNKVRTPQLARYSDIFIKQYLTTPESELLLPELIRFVIRVVHPSNEILGSDVLQRWNFILILLSNCKTAQGLNNCLLALFYDWILFDGVENNIMNIEPAILLLMNVRITSLRVLGKPLLATLIDYLCRIPFEFYPPIAAKTRKSVIDSFTYVMEKRVIPSLAPIFEGVPEDLRTSLRKSFPEIFGEDPTGPRLVDRTNINNGSNGGNGKPISHKLPDSTPAQPILPKTQPLEVPMDTNFDEPEEEIKYIPPKISPAKKAEVQPTRQKSHSRKPKHTYTLSECIEMLQLPLQPLFAILRDGSDEEKCAAMEEFVVDVINNGNHFDIDDCELIAMTLALTIKPIYDRFLLPDPLTDETFEDSVQSPLFILFRRLWEEVNICLPRERVLALLSEMAEFMPDIGFLLVYYMIYKDSKQAADDDRDGMADFEDFCVALRRKTHNGDNDLDVESFIECIADCLDRCGHHDHRMLVHLAHFFYREAPKVAKDSALVAHVTISHIDAWDLRRLCNLILQKKLVMFTEKNCANVIKESLKWETIEQTFFWKLFHAHGFKGDHWVMELLKELDFKKHPEAAMQAFEALKDSIPREDVFREILRREPSGEDQTFPTLAMQWSTKISPADLGDMFARIIAKLLMQKKRMTKQTTTPKGDLTIEHILGHIASLQAFVADADRTAGNKKGRDGDLTQTLYNPNLEVALRKTKDSAPESVREKFREVFSLVTDLDDDDVEVKVLTTKKSKKHEEKGTKRKHPKTANTSRPGSSRHSSDEEPEAVSKPKKNRNKSPPFQVDY